MESEFVLILPPGLWSLEAYAACKILSKEKSDRREAFRNFYNSLEDVIENSEEKKLLKKPRVFWLKRWLNDIKKVTKTCGDLLDGSKVLGEVTNRKYGEYGARQSDNAERRELPRVSDIISWFFLVLQMDNTILDSAVA
ncbi:14059_t:CDS:2, partial [Dentiscutata erythropus]